MSVTTARAITSAAPGTGAARVATLAGSTVQFQWNGGSGVTDYQVTIGAAAGGEEIYSQDQGMNLSATVTGLPSTVIFTIFCSAIMLPPPSQDESDVPESGPRTHRGTS